MRGVLAEREFRLLFLGQSISAFGDRVVHLALTFAVLESGGSAADVGIVLAAGAIPYVVFLLVGGVFADRFPRQRVMLSSDLVRAFSQVLSGGFVISGAAEIWHLMVLQFVFGTAQAFFQPAETGLVPLTVSPENLQKANAMLGFSRNFTDVVGPACAGILVATVGPGWGLVVDGVTFLVSAAFLGRMESAVADATVEVRNFMADLREGWREFISRQWLWTSVIVFSLWHLLVLAPFLVLGPVVSERALGGAASWALISATWGLGSVCGALLAMRFQPKRMLLWMYLLLLPESLKLALLASEASVAMIALSAGLSGVGLSFGLAMWFTTMQENVPSRSISRVSSYDWMGSVLMLPVGLALSGTLSESVGTLPILLGAAAANAILIVVALSLVPSLRRFRRREVGL